MRKGNAVRIVLAPDSFKESLSARQAAEAMARGVRAALPGAEVVTCPLADGGEGSLEVLRESRGGEVHSATVGGLLGAPVRARYLRLPGGAVALEAAEVLGLGLLPSGDRDPLRACSRGLGELLRTVLDGGAMEVLVCLGGSGSVDGGAGLLRALGARLLDDRGKDLPPGGGELARLSRADLSGLVGPGVPLRVLCDVDSPLTGLQGASLMFGPQKGATPDQALQLDRALERYAAVLGGNPNRSGAGAAGGLGYALALLGGELLPGARVLAGLAGLSEKLRGADLVLTGEGRLDASSARGKVVAEVVRLGEAAGVPVVALAGQLGGERPPGLTAAFAAISAPMPREALLQGAGSAIERLAHDVAALWGMARNSAS